VRSLDSVAMAMMFTFSREIAVKMRPARPGVPRIPSPTIASIPTVVHLDRTQVSVRQFQSQRRLQSLQGRAQLLAAHQETEALTEAGARKLQHFHVGPGQRLERAAHYLGAHEGGARRLHRDQRYFGCG